MKNQIPSKSFWKPLLMGLGLALTVTRAGAAPEPVFYEPMESNKACTPGARIDNPTTMGEGRFGKAALLERRTENMLKDTELDGGGATPWILLNGARLDGGKLTLPSKGTARQVVEGVKDGALHCFSVYARAVGGTGRIALSWEGGGMPVRKEADLSSDWTRLWIAGRTTGGAVTLTLQSLSGTLEVEKPQFEMGTGFPTEFLARGIRGVSGVIWQGSQPLFNAIQGTVSFWFKPNWAGQISDNGISLFCLKHNPEDVSQQASSSISISAWLKDKEAHDWRYAICIVARDQGKNEKQIIIPAQDLAPGWHHLAMAWNFAKVGEGRLTVCLDGEVRATADRLTLNGMEGPQWVSFGQNGGGYLDGWLDEARIYDQELDAAFIHKLSQTDAP